MADLERIGRPQIQQLARQPTGIFHVTPGTAGDRPDAHGVKDGGDACARQLGVMRDDRRYMRPIHLGAGLNVPFQIVRMQLDQAGTNLIPLAIGGPGRHGGPREQVRNHTIFNPKATTAGFAGQHQNGIGKDQLFCHLGVTVLRNGWGCRGQE